MAHQPEASCKYCKAEIYRPEPATQPTLWFAVRVSRHPERCYRGCWDVHVPKPGSYLSHPKEVLNA